MRCDDGVVARAGYGWVMMAKERGEGTETTTTDATKASWNGAYIRYMLPIVKLVDTQRSGCAAPTGGWERIGKGEVCQAGNTAKERTLRGFALPPKSHTYTRQIGVCAN